MNQSPPSPEAAARSQRIMWVVLGVLIVLPLCAIVATLFYQSYEDDKKAREAEAEANQELSEVIAETERLDPRWRLEDVEAGRAVIPAERNSAEVAMAATKMMPKLWPVWDHPPAQEPPEAALKREVLRESLWDLEPQRQLSQVQITALRVEMERAKAARDEARKLAYLTEGRYPITYSDDWIGTLMPHLQGTREIANLLAWDVVLRAQDKEADGALESCRAIFNTGRSVGDEPFIISELVRIALRAVAVGKVERALAQGQPSDAALAELQKLLEKEEAERLTLTALRGERAGFDHLLEAFQTGRKTLTDRDLKALSGLNRSSGEDREQLEAMDLRVPGLIPAQRAAMLRYMNQGVEIAKLPPEQQQKEFAQWDASAKDQPALVCLLAPAVSKIIAADQRARAQLRCAAAALAAERYRLKRGSWPTGWDSLVTTACLREVPVDVFDGKPLRLKRVKDGLVIYSVGPDGEDNGGNLDRTNPTPKGKDLGFRLWDVQKRRQPPAPPKPRMADGFP
jgi:hypothetical protein